MADRHRYKLVYLVKTPNGRANETINHFTTSDPDEIGKHLIENASKYGVLYDLAFSFIPCPVCGKCAVCGE